MKSWLESPIWGPFHESMATCAGAYPRSWAAASAPFDDVPAERKPRVFRHGPPPDLSLSLSLSVRACGRADAPAEQVPAGQKLAIMGVIVLVFSMAEVYFGMAMSSVTLVADGFHNLADAGGFGIAVFANWAQAHARDAGHLTHRTKEQKVERIGLIGGFTNCSITLILTFAAGGDIYIYTNSTLSTYSRTLTVINLLKLLNLLYICILTHTHTHTHTHT